LGVCGVVGAGARHPHRLTSEPLSAPAARKKLAPPGEL
jgi:hypothetical protein